MLLNLVVQISVRGKTLRRIFRRRDGRSHGVETICTNQVAPHKGSGDPQDSILLLVLITPSICGRSRDDAKLHCL